MCQRKRNREGSYAPSRRRGARCFARRARPEHAHCGAVKVACARVCQRWRAADLATERSCKKSRRHAQLALDLLWTVRGIDSRSRPHCQEQLHVDFPFAQTVGAVDAAAAPLRPVAVPSVMSDGSCSNLWRTLPGSTIPRPMKAKGVTP